MVFVEMIQVIEIRFLLSLAYTVDEIPYHLSNLFRSKLIHIKTRIKAINAKAVDIGALSGILRKPACFFTIEAVRTDFIRRSIAVFDG